MVLLLRCSVLRCLGARLLRVQLWIAVTSCCWWDFEEVGGAPWCLVLVFCLAWMVFFISFTLFIFFSSGFVVGAGGVGWGRRSRVAGMGIVCLLGAVVLWSF